MSAGLIPGMGTNVPRGVGAIGRDYNIQLDKVEKYRQQGTWTEEDEKEWAKKKPFLCEICGDRVSSKANLNRHCKTRHFRDQEHDNKRFACDICGKVCKREDNVVKHKKQKHSILAPLPGRERGSGLNQHRASYPGPGYTGVPEGWNWQDPRFQAAVQPPAPPKAYPPEESSESESETDQDAQNQDGVTRDAEGDDLMLLTREFRRVAVAEDLPPKPVRGLKKYYTDFPILPQELLSHYADYYFQPPSLAFHPHLPLIHRPTFDPEGVLASYLRAICCIGGLYDPTDRTLARQLWESGWKVMERWIDWGIGDDEDAEDEEYVDGLSMPNHRLHEAHMQSIQEEKELSPEQARKMSIGRRWREQRLQVIQGLLLFEVFGIFCREKEWHKKGRRLHSKCIEIAREYQYFEEDHTKAPSVDKSDDPKGHLQQEWEIFVEKECRKRAAFVVYILDCSLSLLFNIPPLLRPTELRNLSLPCDEDLFNAATAEEWDFTRRVRHYEPVPIMFLKTLRAILKGNMNAVNQDLNDFSSYILVVAVLIEITKVAQKVAVEEDEEYEDGRPRVMIFTPRERIDDVEKMEVSLDILRTLSCQRNEFFERHVGKSPSYDSNPTYSPVKSPSSSHYSSVVENMTGCAKCFYILWHLSYVFLYVPDRLVLSGDVPIDIDGCLRGIVEETRVRLERDEEMDIATLEEAIVKLSPHLLAIMRFLENRTYDESRTEFPTIVVLTFRATMIIWEIIVRVNFFSSLSGLGGTDDSGNISGIGLGSGTNLMGLDSKAGILGSSSRGGYNASGGGGGHGGSNGIPIGSSYSSRFGTSSAGGTGGSGAGGTGEAFVAEIMDCIHLPSATDEQPLERAETRFLRWVQATFDDMSGWDVGPMVSASVDEIVEEFDRKAEGGEE